MAIPSDIHPDEWPREKLLRSGPESLSNAELLALVLGAGSRGKHVLALAAEVVERLACHGQELSMASLLQIEGIGPGKGCQILASIEFSRRFLLARRKVRIHTPRDALPFLAPLKGSAQERFLVLTLDGGNHLIKAHPVTVGLVNQSQIHPRETFYPAVQDRAVSILLAHNHPSGNLEPSEADLVATRRLVEVSKTLGIPILDHMIVSENGYLSLRERYPAYFQ